MKKLFMKICDYEESSGSLIVSFASDETKSQNPGDYPAYAYQPATMFPDISDPATVKERLAQAGQYMAEQQKIKENFFIDEKSINTYKSMVGSTTEYNVADLNPVNPNVEEIVTMDSNTEFLKSAIREVLLSEGLIK